FAACRRFRSCSVETLACDTAHVKLAAPNTIPKLFIQKLFMKSSFGGLCPPTVFRKASCKQGNHRLVSLANHRHRLYPPDLILSSPKGILYIFLVMPGGYFFIFPRHFLKPQTPLEQLRRRAKAGDAHAQLDYGVKLQKGEGIPKDP